MSAPAKFLFDVDFGAGEKARPAEPMITLAEHNARLAEAEGAGYRRGAAAAEAQARANAQRSTAAALERIGAEFTRMSQSLEALAARLETEAIEVAVAVARKLAPELMAREPFAEIAALVSECFRQTVRAPHIAVRVNDALHATAREQLEQIARTVGFEGRLVVLAEPDIAVGDCRVEWADGGLVRDRAAVEAAISDTVARYVKARISAGPA